MNGPRAIPPPTAGTMLEQGTIPRADAFPFAATWESKQCSDPASPLPAVSWLSPCSQRRSARRHSLTRRAAAALRLPDRHPPLRPVLRLPPPRLAPLPWRGLLPRPSPAPPLHRARRSPRGRRPLPGRCHRRRVRRQPPDPRPDLPSRGPLPQRLTGRRRTLRRRRGHRPRFSARNGRIRHAPPRARRRTCGARNSSSSACSSCSHAAVSAAASVARCRSCSASSAKTQRPT